MQFKDIEGQRVLINHLIQIADWGHVSHAHLFLGDTLSGSLQLAIAFAQYIGCPNKQHYDTADPEQELTADSCGTCPHCKKYQALQHPDLHFVFPYAATEAIKGTSISSNDFQGVFHQFLADYHQKGSLQQWLTALNIENKQVMIREADADIIVRTIGMKSYEGKKKVVVIWLAEKMNPTAANKLLKALEEPLGDTLFLLVAENADSMLDTIISRTQMVKVPSLTNRSQALDDEWTEKFSTLFVDWMRMLFKLNMATLSTWVANISTIGREWQRMFLQFALEAIHQSLLANLAGVPLKYDFHDAKFNSSFPQMITPNNIESIAQALNDTLYAIERNANPKIAFMELSFKISKSLKKR